MMIVNAVKCVLMMIRKDTKRGSEVAECHSGGLVSATQLFCV